MTEPARHARALVGATTIATLATLSEDGSPWASLVAYAPRVQDGGIDRRRRLPGVERLDRLAVLLGDRLALELHRRRQLIAARQPVALDDDELLDLLDPRELRVGRVDALLDLLAHLVVVRERLERRVLDALLLRPHRREVGVEHDERCVVGLGVADGDRVADQR